MVIYEKIDVPCSKVYFKGMTMPTFLYIYIHVCTYIFTNEGKGESRRKEEPGRGRMVWKERGERESIK